MRNAGRRVENPRYYKQKSVLPLSPLLETMLKLVANTPGANAVLNPKAASSGRMPKSFI